MFFQVIVTWIAKLFIGSDKDGRLYEGAQKIDINSTFFVENLACKGGVIRQYIEATSLRVIDGQLHVCGWCEALPSFQSIPVHQILQLADEQTGEIVPRGAIAGWLIKRSLN